MNYVELYHLALLSKDSIDYGWPNRIGYLARINEEEDKMNISKMTKEDALKAIEDLKAYIEMCEDKEKEIPRMTRGLLPKAQPVIVCPWKKGEDKPLWWKDVTEVMTFNEDDTYVTWGILAYELAQLMYAREYLGIESLHADQDANDVYRLVYDVYSGCYKVNHYGCVDPCEDEILWFFKERKDAERTRDYMNKYVKDVKKNMY